MKKAEAREQRQEALGCMILTIMTAVAVFASVFGRGRSDEIASARAVLSTHEKLLLESDAVLEANKKELNVTRGALDSLKRAHRGTGS